MNIGYQASKNRLTTSASLTEEQSFRLRRMVMEDKEKISPFIGRLIDIEWTRRHREFIERDTNELQAA